MSVRNPQGFLLLEVMLALAVLTGAILVVFQPCRSSLRVTRLNRQSYQAALLLEDHVEVLEKTGISDLEPLEDSLLGPVMWQQDILPGDNASWHSQRLTLTWGDEPHAQHQELSAPVTD